MRLRTHIVLVTGLTLIVAAVLFGIATFQAEEHALLSGMDAKLLATARLAREILPADYHDRISGADSVSDAEYLRIVGRWNRLCTQMGLEYIWSLMQIDGKTVFTSGTSTSKDVTRGDHARFFETHSNPELYAAAFATQEPQYQINDDKWGRIKVVLLPFRDARGRPYLFGASMKTTDVDALMNRTTWMSVAISAGILLLGMAISVLFAHSLARPLEMLTNLTTSITTGNWGHVVETSGALEIRSLAHSINVMSQSIQEKTHERQRAEEERKKLQAQFNQAQKMESVGRLAGGVAHDFNNMLGAILGYAELALERVDPAHPVHADLEEIRKAASRSADLTRQLLAFARKQTIAPKVLDLNETVAGMLSMLRRLIGEDIRLMWKPDADLWAIKMDPSQIDQILANLCINARDAIADVGMVTIETGNRTIDADYCANHAGFVPGAYVQLSVSDTGCGMDAETQSQIFEPFFTTKAVGQGTGLGLATVYGAVKQNHGFIHVYSEPEHGTTMTIYLPRHVGGDGRARTDQRERQPVRGHETILLVEDEPAILNLTATMLERQGYKVLAARTPADAIRRAGEYAGEIRLLVTDVVMPEMNGGDLATTLLALRPHMARLFMSGYPADVMAHHGMLDDGMFFIQKPFSINDLAAAVREAMGSVTDSIPENGHL